jgi:hypothetical protein
MQNSTTGTINEKKMADFDACPGNFKYCITASVIYQKLCVTILLIGTAGQTHSTRHIVAQTKNFPFCVARSRGTQNDMIKD